MKPVSVDEIYPAVEGIVGRFRAMGLNAWSVRLAEAVSAGATSGEILMAVRWKLKELKKEKPGLTRDLERAIEKVIEQIDRSGA